MSGLIGIKCGTSRYVREDGTITQATLIYVDANHITAVKTKQKDGYNALQLASCPVQKELSKPKQGYYAKRSMQPQRVMKEFRVDDKFVSEYAQGDTLSVEYLNDFKEVNVAAISKGKGFSGCVKRHNFSMQRATHGNSLSHRAPGAIGQCQFPGRVNKGKKMAGQYGATRITIKNLEVLKVDGSKNLLIVRGSVPGMPGAVVHVYGSRSAAKV